MLQMYTELGNLVYLKFLQPIMGDQQTFQQANPGKLLSDLKTFYYSLVDCGATIIPHLERTHGIRVDR
jgi:hypothetical protein